MNLEVPRGSYEAHDQSSGNERTRPSPRIIDISLELDATKFRMRTYEAVAAICDEPPVSR